MATNFIQDGNEIEVTLSGSASSGDIIVKDGIVGVALIDVPQEVTGSTMCTVKTRGVFTVASDTTGFDGTSLTALIITSL